MSPIVLAKRQGRAGDPQAAAQAAADCDRPRWLYPSSQLERDLYVRAFLAGAQWQQAQLQVTTREAQYLDGFVTGFEELQARGFFLHHEDGRVLDYQDFLEAMVIGMNAILQKTTIWRAGSADKDTSPSTGSTASPDTGEREHRGKS